jgi:hypothetical protein
MRHYCVSTVEMRNLERPFDQIISRSKFSLSVRHLIPLEPSLSKDTTCRLGNSISVFAYQKYGRAKDPILDRSRWFCAWVTLEVSHPQSVLHLTYQTREIEPGRSTREYCCFCNLQRYFVTLTHKVHRHSDWRGASTL